MAVWIETLLGPPRDRRGRRRWWRGPGGWRRRLGLAGVIYGVGLGWFLRAIVSFAVVARHLRIPSGVPATAP